MSNSRKYLKIISKVILMFAGFSLINIVSELFFGDLNSADVIANTPSDIILTTKIFISVVSFIFLLPQFYIGFKGIKVANSPDSSRGHIIWAAILLVISVIASISPIMVIVRQGIAFSALYEIVSIAIEIVIFGIYVVCANAVLGEN